MLSNQPSNIHTRQRVLRQHQQQTPVIFEAQHIPFSSAQQQGFSDQGMGYTHHQPQSQNLMQNQTQVGITNTGQQTQQHLQVAQQQQRQAQPGQQQDNPNLHLSEQEFRDLQHQQLDAHIDSLLGGPPQATYSGDPQHHVKIERSRSHPGPQHIDQQNDFLQAEAMQRHLSLDNQQTVRQRRHVRPSSMDRTRGGASPPNMHLLRQFTPSEEGTFDNKPSEPVMGNSKHQRRYTRERFSDVDTHATIKPVKQQILVQGLFTEHLTQGFTDSHMIPEAQSSQARSAAELLLADIFTDRPSQAQHDLLPTPPHTAPIKRSRHYDVATIPDNVSLDTLPNLDFGPFSNGAAFEVSQNQGFIESCPSTPSTGAFPGRQEQTNGPTPSHSVRSSVDFSAMGSPSRLLDSPCASMTDLDLEGTIEDTGVTQEEVQAYIGEPDATRNKWICLYPECSKQFGRRENIKAHVQTHLNDRPYKCLHCNKRFVRQHDLKRHAKIHSGVKPYPCACGNSFARHDALTRHRQRGICNGGYEGVVKKLVKRGRPPKRRPNDDDRVDKAARTRKHANDRSYTSSVSCTSQSSMAGSPEYSSPFSDDFVTEMRMQTVDIAMMDMDAMFVPESSSMHTPPQSPHESDSQCSPAKARTPCTSTSPSSEHKDKERHTWSEEQQQTTVSMADMYQGGQWGSQMGSQPGSPPALSACSPPSSGQLQDADLRSTLQSQGTDGSGEHDYNASPAFEMLLSDLSSHVGNGFDNTWDENNFFNFDKSTSSAHLGGFNDGFGDEILFSDDM